MCSETERDESPVLYSQSARCRTSAEYLGLVATVTGSPSTMYVTVSVKQAAVPLHVGVLPSGGPLLAVLEGRYENARKPATITTTTMTAMPVVHALRCILQPQV